MHFNHHHDLTDKQYEDAAHIHLKMLADEASSSEKARREYGRWMITSLVIAHSAALAGLARLGNPDALAASGRYFIAGLVLGFLAGFCASAYFAMNTRRLFYLSDPSAILQRPPKNHVPKRLRVMLWIAYGFSVVAGLVSVAMIFVGANAVQRCLTGTVC